ncbi:YdbH domain-containing protein [Caenispirillum salinarum]|uniref:intermembrane phospholipid transport protein YdbH family protein n=1 Tax=Caenispirillum salinarum TaxID=859058 RepID=UPI00384D85CC
MSRRFIITLLIVIVTLIALGAAFWRSLPTIAEHLVISRLEAQGLGPVEAEVARVDLTGARLESLTLGDGAATVSGATLAWRARALAPESLTIESLRLTGRWTADDGLTLGPLDALLHGSEDGGAAADGYALPVPRIDLRDARAEIALPGGTLTATGRGTILRAEPGPALDLTAEVDAPGLAGRMSFQGTAAGSGATPVTGEGRVRLTAAGFTAPGVAGAIDGELSATIAIGADTVTVTAENPVTLTLRDLAPALAAPLADVLRAGTSADGPVRITLSGAEGGAPAFTVSGLDDPASLAVASDGLRLAAEAADARASASAAGSLRLEDGLPTAALHDLSAEASGLVIGGVPIGGALADGNATLSAAGIAAEGDLALSTGAAEVGDVAAQAAALEARLRLSTQADGTGALYAERGTLRVEGLRPAPDLAVTAPVVLTLTETEAPLVRLSPLEGGDGLRADIRAAFADPDLRLRRSTGDGDRLIRAAFDRLAVEAVAHLPEGRAPEVTAMDLDGSGGLLTVDAITLTDAAMDATLGPHGPRLSVSGRMAALPGEPSALAERSPLRPYRLSLTASPTDEPRAAERFALEVDLRDAAQTRLASATGWADLAEGTGRLRLDMPRQVFDPKALRPEHLHGALGTFASGVTGAVAAEGTLAWGPGGLDPDLNLMLRDLSLSQGFVTLRRINGVIRLTSLDPLRTPLGQTVSVAMVEAGLPLTNVTADFQLDGDRLHIDSARATLADGTLTADPASLPLDLASGTMTLRVRDMRLAPLVDLLNIEGLDAAGALGGEIPLRFAGGDVVIDNAVLRSQGPDRVAYAPEAPPDALSGGGQSVDMVMEALEDFRYNTLRVTVDGRASGELTVTLHIAGHNPAFYDGYPVEFNLSVSGALAEAVQAGLQGYQVPDRIRERMMNFQNGQ